MEVLNALNVLLNVILTTTLQRRDYIHFKDKKNQGSGPL